MPRTTGLRIGPKRYEIVALDGSSKKPKLRGFACGRVPAGEDALVGLEAAIKESFKQHRKELEAEEVQLTIDGGLGVYRHLSLPFADHDKIEEVLRFEVESKIPQWDIDDLVVDFFITDSTPVESHLLVTAVPKKVLSERLEVATRCGLEPVEAELETASLFHAAEFVGALTAGHAQLLVHLGERTTSIVVSADGKLKTMRALHIALDGRGGESTVEQTGDLEGDSDGVLAGVETFDPELAERLRERLLKEFLRTLTSADSGVPFDKIWVCGLVPPGLIGSQVGETEVVLLDPLGACGVNEPAPEERARYTIAFGAAWRRLGSTKLNPHLRRDELAYAGTFERLELPLGVLGLLLLTLLFSQYIIVKKQVAPRADDVRLWMDCIRNYTVGTPESGNPGLLSNPPKTLVATMKGVLAGDYNDDLTPLEQMDTIRVQLEAEIRKLKSALGTGDTSSQPQSALSGSNLVLDVISGMGEDRLGRIAIRKLDAQWRQGNKNRDPEHIDVKLDVSFFAETDLEATNHYNALLEELEAQPWCLNVGRRQLEPFSGENSGVATDGLEIQVDVSKAVAAGEQASAATPPIQAPG